MKYADFNFYKSTYLGKAIDVESDFNFYAELGAEYISASTLGKATADNEQVKKCNCRIADILKYHNAKLTEPAKRSESVGGYSVTYDMDSVDRRQLKEQIYNAIVLYLAQTGLLYRGTK